MILLVFVGQLFLTTGEFDTAHNIKGNQTNYLHKQKPVEIFIH